MITLRLDTDLEQRVSLAALQMGVSKSEFVRKSLSAFMQQQQPPTAWELGSNLFGKYESGMDNLAEDRKALLKNKMSNKVNAS
jgi:RHH-type rel operon transcriptional repressor/antitoxin RelB